MARTTTPRRRNQQQQNLDENPPGDEVETLRTQLADVQAQLAQMQTQLNERATGTTPRFARTPAKHNTGFLDFDKKADYNTWKMATGSLYQEPQDRYDLDPANTQTFLNKVYDRSQNYNLSCLEVPSEEANLATSPKKNYCKHHKQFPQAHLKKFVETYIQEESRMCQDDGILLLLLQNSLAEDSYKSISTDRSEYTIQGHESGLLLLYKILDESAVDTMVDPDVIRKRLALSADKFVELGHDVKKFNSWITEQVDQLKQTGVDEKDLDYLRAFIHAAYDRTPDKELYIYVQQQMDQARDHPENEYSWKQFMSRVSKKVDSLQQATTHAALANTTTEDPILTLQAEVKQQQKLIAKLTKKSKKADKKAQGKSGDKSKKQGKKKDSDYVPFPEELKTKPKPADTNKALVIDGQEYWWCTTHDKWGKHTLAACKVEEAKRQGKTAKAGNRQGRYVKALAAIPDDE